MKGNEGRENLSTNRNLIPQQAAPFASFAGIGYQLLFEE
jgi:hypothetical protein